MKKSLIITLALVFVLGIAGTAFAAANPFVDVPAKHWAYEAVSKLAAAGIVDGYGDGTFRGDKTITRYEMAQIVAKAMAKSDKADAQQKAIIDKLAVEFAAELNNLGVRVAKLEKNASAIKVTGESRVRYTWNDSDKSGVGADAFDWRQRLHLSAAVTDKISYGARLEATGKFGGETSDATARFGRNFFTIKDLFGVDSVTVGRMGLAIGRNMAIAKTNDNDGIRFDHMFGSTAVSGYYVEEDRISAGLKNDEGAVEFVDAVDAADLRGINVNFNNGKAFEYNVGYMDADYSGARENAAYLNGGFSYNFQKGWTLVGDYVQSDVAGDPKAYAAQLVYNWKSGKVQKGLWSWEKLVNPAIAHDQGVALTYRSIEKDSLPGAGAYGTFAKVGTVGTGNQEGFSLGYQNAVAKNVLLSLEYHDIDQESGAASDKQALAYFEFFF
jgi:hypothetical protein